MNLDFLNTLLSPSLLAQFRPWVLGAALAYLAYLGLAALPVWKSSPGNKRLEQFAGLEGDRQKIAVGSQAHKVRLAFAAYGLDVTGSETAALALARVGMGLLIAAAILLGLGLPPLVALAGLAVGWIVVDGLVNGAWLKMVAGVERDVPTFLSRLASVVQVTPNVLGAVAEVGETLSPRSPLRAWLERFLGRCQAQGRPGFEAMLAEAQALSPSLGLAVFEIGRLWETGGEGYAAAFALAADNLGDILQGRAVGNAKADGVKGAIRIVLLVLAGVVAVYIRAPQFGPILRQPLMQLLYVGIAVWMAMGWSFTGGMIEEALR